MSDLGTVQKDGEYLTEWTTDQEITDPAKKIGGGGGSGKSIGVMQYPVGASDDNTEDCLLIKAIKYIAPGKGEGMGIEISSTRSDDGGTSTGGGTINLEKINKYGKGDLKLDIRNDNRTDIINKRMKDGSFKESVKWYVKLPIPSQVNDICSVTWGADTLNVFEQVGLTLGAGAISSGNVVENSLGAIKLGGRVAAGELKIPNLSEEARNNFVAAVSGAAINVMGSNVTADSVMARANGQIMNSNLELLFQGVNLRTFPFDMTFAPRNRDEMMMVKRIIRSFKKSMAAKMGRPDGTLDGAGGAKAFLRSPDMFILRYLRRGEDHPFLHVFKPCVLTTFNVNYTGAGTYATYGDSTPVNIQVRMTFKEINPIYAEDYDEEFAGEGVGY
tara:strand:- start:106 stop:1266 length:1161 start_codon:yes stop_codon:yes gene_type:complete